MAKTNQHGAKIVEGRYNMPIEMKEDLQLIKKELGITETSFVISTVRKAIEECPSWLPVGTRRKSKKDS